jgi:hypothetical protein
LRTSSLGAATLKSDFVPDCGACADSSIGPKNKESATAFTALLKSVTDLMVSSEISGIHQFQEGVVMPLYGYSK